MEKKEVGREEGTADRKDIKDNIGKCVSHYWDSERSTENHNINIGFVFKSFNQLFPTEEHKLLQNVTELISLK